MDFLASSGLELQGLGVMFATSGAVKTAKGQIATLQYQSAVAHNNALLAEYQSQQDLAVGAAQEQAVRSHVGTVFHSQRAAMAANGIDLGVGSATEVLASTMAMGEHDALTVRDNAARKSWADQMQAQNYENQATVDTSTADAISPTTSGISTLLSGAGQVASSWFKYDKSINGASAP
jgi:hypothetical protein